MNFYPRDAYMHSAVFAVAPCLSGSLVLWLAVCHTHTAVLCQNDKTYLKTFSTFW